MSSTKSPDLSCEWHVLTDGQRRGPYTLSALNELLGAHPQGRAAQVWRPGMLDWRPAQQVLALAESERASLGARAEAGAATRDLEPPPVTRLQELASAIAASAPAESEAWRMATRGPAASVLAISADGSFAPTPHDTVPAQRRTAAPGRPAPLNAETTHELPVYRSPHRAYQTGYFVVGAAGTFALFALLVALKMRATHAPEPARAARYPARVATPAPPPVSAAAPAMALPESAPAPVAAPVDKPPAPRPTPVRAPDSPASSATAVTGKVTNVRVRAAWAPVRADADPAAPVLCSVPRGSGLSVYGERPGTHLRWFNVHCDKQQLGWVHENFLAPVRAERSRHSEPRRRSH